MTRAEILEEVADVVSGVRNDTHGDPVEQLALEGMIKRKLREHNYDLLDVEAAALDAIVLKITRLVCGYPQDDHWRDILGYAAIGAEARYAATRDEVAQYEAESEIPF